MCLWLPRIINALTLRHLKAKESALKSIKCVIPTAAPLDGDLNQNTMKKQTSLIAWWALVCCVETWKVTTKGLSTIQWKFFHRRWNYSNIRIPFKRLKSSLIVNASLTSSAFRFVFIRLTVISAFATDGLKFCLLDSYIRCLLFHSSAGFASLNKPKPLNSIITFNAFSIRWEFIV